MSDLKPCPFCGNVNAVWKDGGWIECPNCHIYFSSTFVDADKEEHIEAWNRRVSDEDSIRREDAIRSLNDYLGDCYRVSRRKYEKTMLNAISSDFKAILYKLPSADVVERKTGEGIDIEIPLEDGGSMPAQACNRCKTFYPLAYTGGGHNFCPNCGARMKGANDD